jgi:hypothetical protein
MSVIGFGTQRWRRSSFCATGTCIQVKQVGDKIFLRDSKNPRQAPLRFDRDEFRAFADGIIGGEFNDLFQGNS